MSYKIPNWAYNLFIVGFSFVILIYIVTLSVSLISGTITPQKYFIEYGDSFAAFLTAFSIAFILYQIRSQENVIELQLEEASKERNLSIELNYFELQLTYLDKQTAFYSKLLGKLNQCWQRRQDSEWVPLLNEFREKMDEDNIPYEYESFAKTILKDKLRNYYTVLRTANITAGTSANNELIELMNDIKKLAINDFQELQQEYRQTLQNITDLIEN